MPILLLLLSLLASAASTRQEDRVILITGGWADASYDDDYTEGLILSSTEVLGSSYPVPSLPLPLHGHITFLTADGLVLTCGGMDGDFNNNFDCFALDASCQSWVPHSTLPTDKVLPSSVSLPVGVFLFDGRWGGTFLPTGSTEWLEGPHQNNDAATCAVAISASKFLVIGGSPDPKLVEEFDTGTASWTSWPPLEQGRSYHSCMRAGNNVVIAGGLDEDMEVIASTTILSINDKSQRPGGDMSFAKDLFQMVNYKENILAIGGDQGRESGGYGGPGLDLVEEWDETTEEWTAREGLRMGTSRFAFGAVSI